SAPVNEQGPSSDPNIASSSRLHESAPDQFTSTNVEDDTMGGSFHTSPPRSIQAPPEGTTSGGAKDLDKLTALSSLVSTLVQKVNTQESELQAHKLLFKEVVGKLVKNVKLLEDKLKGRKRKFVMTDSDKEKNAEQDVDPLIKLAKAAATAAAASAVPTGGSYEANIPPSSSIPSDEFVGGSVVPVGATIGPSADPSNKGKSPLLAEDPPVRERTFRHKEEDRLGEEAARRMYEEEQDELEREREEMQRKRQQDVLNSAKYYTDSDWTDIMGQVHANQGLTADLLGPDVNEDNFAERMKAYMRTFVKNQSSTIYTTGWTMKHVKSFSDDQLKTEFDKIRTAVAELKSLNIRRSLKRPGADLEHASSKKSKPTEDPKSFVPDESQQPSVEVPPTATQQPFKFSSEPTIPSADPRTHSYGTKRKVLLSQKKSLLNDTSPDFLAGICCIGGDTSGLEMSMLVLHGLNQTTMGLSELEVISISGVHVLETISARFCISFQTLHILYQFNSEEDAIRLESIEIVTTSRYVVPTGRVKVPAGRYVVPTGKDNIIVSAGRTKVIPAGRTILVLVNNYA
ncbi:hypothetical protein Tco_0071246, partial [Tanacetum coccineum]